jgi:uncharacterized protein YukJ
VYGSGYPAGYFSGAVQTTSKITMYNGAYTVANGVPSIVAEVAFSSNGSGNNIYVTIITPTNDAIYRITGFMECSGTSSGNTYFSLDLAWTVPTGQAGFGQVNGGTCGPRDQQYASATVIAHAKGGAPLQYNYAGMDAPFQVTLLVEQLL